MAWMAVAASIFAAMNLFARMASKHVPWSEVASARMFVGAGVATLSAFSRGVSLRTYDRRLAWGRSLFGSCAMLCVFYTLGAPAIALGDAATLLKTNPIFIALLSPVVLGEKGEAYVWWAMLLSFAGAALIAGPSFQLRGSVALVALLGALFTAMAMMWLRRLGRGARESPEAIAIHFSLVSGCVTALISIPGFRIPDAKGAFFMLLTGLCGGVAQLAMTRAYALDKAARVGAMDYLTTVVSYILGMAVLGERPGKAEAVGAALVVFAGVGLAVMTMRRMKRYAKEP